MPRLSKESKKKLIQSLSHLPSLHNTIARMSADGKLSQERERYILSHLEEWISDSKYILFNLAVHMGIGFVRFAAFPFPLPIGSTLRALWVMANRMYCNLRLDMHRKKVHSISVLLFSIIPFLGYFAYTIPLKRKSEYLTYLYVQHINYTLYDMPLEDRLEKTPKIIKKLGYTLLMPEELKIKSQKKR
jgi:hypothetical protein